MTVNTFFYGGQQVYVKLSIGKETMLSREALYLLGAAAFNKAGLSWPAGLRVLLFFLTRLYDCFRDKSCYTWWRTKQAAQAGLSVALWDYCAGKLQCTVCMNEVMSVCSRKWRSFLQNAFKVIIQFVKYRLFKMLHLGCNNMSFCAIWEKTNILLNAFWSKAFFRSCCFFHQGGWFAEHNVKTLYKITELLTNLDGNTKTSTAVYFTTVYLSCLEYL